MQLPFDTNSSPVTFLIGGTGAGKTELALNLSVWQAARHNRSVLVDLDIVNPFFRVRKLRKEVEARGVEIVCPISRVVSGDIPALPPQAWGIIEQSDSPVVCDIGGGEPGLRPLGRLRELAEARSANVIFVINPFRPGFANIDQITESFRHMSGLCAMTVTHVVANPNVSDETSPEEFMQGLDLVREFADNLKVELAFSIMSGELAEKSGIRHKQLPEFTEFSALPVFVIERYWKNAWQFGVFPD